MSIDAQVLSVEQVKAKFEAFPAVVRSALVKDLDRLGYRVEGYIQREELQGQILNHRTGKLSSSITHTPPEDSGSSITTKVGVFDGLPYARPLEEGAAPHLIEPVQAKVLAFMAGGKQVFAKFVNHPGNRAYAYLRLGLQANADAIMSDLNATVAGAANG